MSSADHPLHNNGIYRNLPTFPESAEFQDLTAIITGANGISGFHTLRVLLQSPKRWKKIYALSRRPPPEEMMALLPEDQRSRVQHVAVDFLSSAEDIAKSIKSAELTRVDYIFFYSYLQPPHKAGSRPWSNAQELVDVNSALLRNFLGSLPLANLTPKRFLLQTGAKNYGAHLGTIRSPAIESDPRPTLEPNFYYPQEDMLWDFCKSNPSCSWNVIRPAWIIGAVNNAQMNALHPFAVYAAVCAHRNVPLSFPGDFTAWQAQLTHSTAMLTGYLSEWAVLEDKCKNEAFNSTDMSPFVCNRFWPELGRWYGVKEISRPEEDESKYTEMTGPEGKDTPMGYGPHSKTRTAFTLTTWASDPSNAQAWHEIMSQHHLTHDPFADIQANFTSGDGAFAGFGLCMNKARLLGWTGFVDTTQSLFQMYDEMSRIGMLPPMVAGEPRASV